MLNPCLCDFCILPKFKVAVCFCSFDPIDKIAKIIMICLLFMLDHYCYCCLSTTTENTAFYEVLVSLYYKSRNALLKTSRIPRYCFQLLSLFVRKGEGHP